MGGNIETSSGPVVVDDYSEELRELVATAVETAWTFFFVTPWYATLLHGPM